MKTTLVGQLTLTQVDLPAGQVVAGVLVSGSVGGTALTSITLAPGVTAFSFSGSFNDGDPWSLTAQAVDSSGAALGAAVGASGAVPANMQPIPTAIGPVTFS